MMDSEPRVSVTIIFLNEERFLRDAVESIFAQTYDAWELLLVDDGSTDRSTEIARLYAVQNPGKVSYLEHEGHQNRGMSASRNLGIRNSKGEFIARLDADDVCLPNTLEEQVALMDSHPEAGMVYGPAQMWYGWTGNTEDAEHDGIQKLSIPPHTLIKPPIVLARFLRDEGDEPFGMLVRREVMESIGGYDEVVTSVYEDQALNVKVCLRYPVITSDKSWFKYRQHPKSYCSVARKTGQYESKRMLFYNWAAEYLSKHNIEDPDVWEALNYAMEQQRGRLSQQPDSPPPHRLKALIKLVARQTLPISVRRWLRKQYSTRFARN